LSKLLFTEAFARYGAELVNPQWAVSAIAKDGALVMSCWVHYIKRHGDALRYADKLSRWEGNSLGNELLRRHLTEAYAGNYPVRYLSAKTEDTNTVDCGHDASKVKKVFAVRPELVGHIVEFDGDSFIIDFSRA